MQNDGDGERGGAGPKCGVRSPQWHWAAVWRGGAFAAPADARAINMGAIP